MATLTLRSQKGSPLTNQEVDDNFSNLNSSKLETSGGTLTGPLSTTILTSSNVNGDEGGKLLLARPATNTSIDTSVTIKLHQNKLQIFETGGTYRGAHLDITTSAVDIGSKILTSSNIGSYAPGLTGSGASGTWSISISGNSATVTSITSSQVTSALGYTPYNNSNPSGYQTAANVNAYFGSPTTAGTLDWNDVSNTKPGAYGTLLLGSATNGMGGGNYYHPLNFEYSSKDGTGNVTQLAIAYGSPANEIYMRGRYSGSWSSWVRYLNNANYNSYSPTLTGGGASGTWSISISGNSASVTSITSSQVTSALGYTPYNSTNPSGYITNTVSGTFTVNGSSGVRVFVDGSASITSHLYFANAANTRAYNWQLDENSNAALWGYGGSSWAKLLTVTSAGAFNAVGAITQAGNQVLHAGNYSSYALPTGSSATNSVDIRAPIFYDSNDTGYYLNPNSSSRLNTTFTDNSYSYGWFRTFNQNGLYNETHGNHWYATGNDYWNLAANNASQAGIIFRTSGHQGTIRGYVYADSSNNIGFLNSSGSWRARVVGDDYWLVDGSSARAQLFYDSNDTSYYLDPASTTNLNVLYTNGLFLSRNESADRGISWYSPSYTAWTSYMAHAGHTGCGPTANITAPSGTYVTTWALREFIEGASGYGWTWESGTASGQPTVVAEIRASDGLAKFGSLYTTIFYDSNDTGYYLNPNGTSQLSYVLANDWFRSQGSTGLYFQDYGYGIRSAHGEGNNYGNATTYGTGRNNWSGWGIGSRWVLMSTGGDNIGIHDNSNTWLYYWNGTYHQFNRGYTEAQGSLRAPIFYDSNDTGYYIDANSTSRIRKTNLIASGSGWDDGLNLYSSDASNRWNLLVDDGASDALRIAYNNSEALQISTGRNITALVDFRTPIFYDYNDTAYYVNPNGSSLLNAVYLEGYGNNRAIGKTHSSSDFGSGTLVTTNIPANTWAGASFILECTGKSYSSSPPFNFIVQGYLYNDTIINCSGIQHGTPLSYIRVFESGGVLCFWWPRWGYWNSFEVRVRDAGGDSANRVTSITDSALPSGNKMVTVGLYNTAIYNFNSGTGDLYASIYYDSNDTGYYLDPNSTSNSALRIRGGTLYGPNVNWGAYLLVGGNGREGYVDNASTASVSTTNGNLHLDSASGYSTYINWYDGNDVFIGAGNSGTENARFYNSGYLQLRESLRAPIFYDSNDTGYYWDGASTSKWNESNQNGWHTFNNYGLGITGSYDSYRLQTVFAMGSAYRMAADGASTANMYGLAWSHPNAGSLGGASNLNDHGLLIINNGTFRAALSSRAVFSADVRGTLFYDYNDTAYYCDPASTNRLNFVNSNNHYIQPGYMLYSDHGSWTGEYNKIQWHSSHLYLQNNGGGYLLILRRGDGGERFYCDYSGNVTASGNITAYSDQRLKTNIQTIEKPLQLVNRLRGVTFDWIETGKHSYGLIAQEVEQVIPELVLETTNGNTEIDTATTVKSVDYSKLVSVLIEAVKEQQQQIENQQQQLADLTQLVKTLVTKLAG